LFTLLNLFFKSPSITLKQRTGIPPVWKITKGEIMDTNYGNGMSPADYAAVTRTGGGVFGSGDGGGLLMGLLFSQLFGGGALGNRMGAAGAHGAHGLADAAAAAAVTSAKDAVAATNSSKDYIDSNIDALSKQCCCSTQDIMTAINAISKQCCCSTQDVINQVNALSPQIMQGFFNAQIQTLNSQNAVTGAITDSKFAISQQLDGHATQAAITACETQNLINTTSAAGLNQAAMHYAATSNQMAQQTCDIKQTVLADGNVTRALINSIETDRLRTELADAKVRISNQEQTASIAAMIAKCCGCGCGCSTNGNGNGNGNGSNPSR
jgi:hypothetical protein